MDISCAHLIPDIVGPLLGVRQWSWREDEERLHSINGLVPYPGMHPTKPGVAWPPGEVMVSRHWEWNPDDITLLHPFEPLGCKFCGLHAFYDMTLIERGIFRNGVWGIIEAWGEIEEHEYGFRAELMRPVAIIEFHRWSKDASRVYGLPMVPLEESGDWMEEREGTYFGGGQKSVENR